MSGTLFVVATPIGNLKDFSFRAVETLKSVDVILCEDTKHSLILLNEYGISKKLISYHKFNEKQKLEQIKTMLDNDDNIALISDAGTPLISDPGFILVKELSESGYKVTTVGGMCALISALVLSGFDTTNFYFFGFLRGEKKDRIEKLNSIKELQCPIIFYISPHKLKDEIQTIYEVLGKRKAKLIKEISKIHESVFSFTLGDELQLDVLKGEFVLVVDKDTDVKDFTNLTIEEHIEYFINMGIDKNSAIKLVAKERGLKKNEVYKKTLT